MPEIEKGSNIWKRIAAGMPANRAAAIRRMARLGLNHIVVYVGTIVGTPAMGAVDIYSVGDDGSCRLIASEEYVG